MISYIMRSLLLILVFALVIDSQARTLTEHCRQLEGFNRRPGKPPPPPNSAPTTDVVAPLLESFDNYFRRGAPPPPPPKSATPVIELIPTGSSEQNEFWTLKNYGKKGRLPPPAPKDAPPTHQVTGGGVAASDQASPSLLLSSV